MSKDTCPVCGEPYESASKGIDFRPKGALFNTYVHSYEDGALNIVDESCQEIIEWGEESDHE